MVRCGPKLVRLLENCTSHCFGPQFRIGDTQYALSPSILSPEGGLLPSRMRGTLSVID